MFQSDWLILRILHQLFEMEIPKGHWSEVVVHLYTRRSSLNSHLYSKNIINSPSCSCGGFESAYHFFFICPIYRHTRTIYLSNVLQTYYTHELLYGKETATDLENEALFLKVQDFIKL